MYINNHFSKGVFFKDLSRNSDGFTGKGKDFPGNERSDQERNR